MKKRLFVLLCAAALLLGLALQAGAAQESWDDDIIFLALNDVPISLSDNTMPIRVGSTIYVPYSTFDANQNGGVRLGVYNGGQVQGRTLTLYNADAKNLTFDLRTGISYDYMDGGERQVPTAIIRSGQIYVSASSTARYFDLDYFQSSLTFGSRSYPFIRISGQEATLSNSMFLSSVSTTYLNQLQIYYQNNVVSQEEPPPSPSQPPAPPQVEEPQGEIQVSLAVRCDTGEAGAAVLEALRSAGRGALFLFSPEQLRAQDDLVRQVVAEGNTVGLIAGAGSLSAARAELEEGNALLARIAHTFTPIVLAEDSAVAEALAEEGWLCWEEGLDGIPDGRRSGSVYSGLAQDLAARSRDARITVDDSQTSAEVVERLMSLFRQDRYEYRMPVETSF